jgi:hypothetical protein
VADSSRPVRLSAESGMKPVNVADRRVSHLLQRAELLLQRTREQDKQNHAADQALLAALFTHRFPLCYVFAYLAVGSSLGSVYCLVVYAYHSRGFVLAALSSYGFALYILCGIYSDYLAVRSGSRSWYSFFLMFCYLYFVPYLLGLLDGLSVLSVGREQGNNSGRFGGSVVVVQGKDLAWSQGGRLN